MSGFIHGCTSEALIEKIESSFFTHSVSLDGSAFDSTQYANLRLAAEEPFWRHPDV